MSMNINETFSLFNELTKQNMERLSALGEINMRAFEKMTQRQMDCFNLFVEQSNRTVKMASESKGSSELLKGQVELGKEMSETMMGRARENMELATELRDEYRAWVQSGVEAAQAEMKKGVAEVAA